MQLCEVWYGLIFLTAGADDVQCHAGSGFEQFDAVDAQTKGGANFSKRNHHERTRSNVSQNSSVAINSIASHMQQRSTHLNKIMTMCAKRISGRTSLSASRARVLAKSARSPISAAEQLQLGKRLRIMDQLCMLDFFN